ncbi:hypothetical protein BpHYR1_051753 [Brachionus plicatilis]|uniref:Uncharacterized protein n=1 Tax=Brachionus plicatilis TaxID=10195 RepID=A0A3M7P9E1_BRAPC|nr:hypothetical protein BpHYR1_051753 [Brachionus plicatilis]
MRTMLTRQGKVCQNKNYQLFDYNFKEKKIQFRKHLFRNAVFILGSRQMSKVSFMAYTEPKAGRFTNTKNQ